MCMSTFIHVTDVRVLLQIIMIANIWGTIYIINSTYYLLLFYQKNKFPYEKFLEILILQPERPLHWICIDCGTELRDTYSTVTNLTKLFQIQILNNTSLCCCCSSSQLKRMIIKILMWNCCAFFFFSLNIWLIQVKYYVSKITMWI